MKIEIFIEIMDEEGEVVASGKPDSALTVDQPHLWQPLNAYLYTAKVTLKDGSKY